MTAAAAYVGIAEAGEDRFHEAIGEEDERFDGLFFAGVVTTGVYCRVVCPTPQRAKRETTEIPIADGVDEVSLALQAEAWGRSMRTKVLTTHAGRTPVRSRHGLVIMPDAEAKPGNHVVEAATLPAVPAFEATLGEMGTRYGASVIRFAVLAMEYDSNGKGN